MTGMEIKEKESYSQLFQLPSLDKQETWFPTLRKTIWVLSQLHDFVNVGASLIPFVLCSLTGANIASNI